MDMPQVKSCNAGQCAFNQNNVCHAHAVTIGDEEAPRCDTFWQSDTAHAGDMQEIAGVGACKMEDCEYNEGLYCTADSIQVKQSALGAVCTTYNPVKAHAKV